MKKTQPSIEGTIEFGLQALERETNGALKDYNNMAYFTVAMLKIRALLKKAFDPSKAAPSVDQQIEVATGTVADLARVANSIVASQAERHSADVVNGYTAISNLVEKLSAQVEKLSASSGNNKKHLNSVAKFVQAKNAFDSMQPARERLSAITRERPSATNRRSNDSGNASAQVSPSSSRPTSPEPHRPRSGAISRPRQNPVQKEAEPEAKQDLPASRFPDKSLSSIDKFLSADNRPVIRITYRGEQANRVAIDLPGTMKEAKAMDARLAALEAEAEKGGPSKTKYKGGN